MTTSFSTPLQRIVCLPDLLRTSQRRYTQGFFDLVREPIRQACGLHIGHAPETPRPHGLAAGFDAEHFRQLAGVQLGNVAHTAQLAASYHQLNAAAEEYLFQHVPADSLLLTMEIPPWLAKGCIQRGIDFLDFAISPLRFGRDLYAALRTSNAEIFQRLHAQSVTPEEIQLEASTLSANLRMHKAGLQELQQFRFQNLDGSLLFFGQSPLDGSLLAPDGRTLRCNDFADRLHALSQGKNVFYKSHPYAQEVAEEEIQALQRIVGKPVTICQQNTYQILSTYEDVELTGISSGVLQEALWFGKTSHTLFQPFVPLHIPAPENDGVPAADLYQQVHFQQLLAPGFWHAVLSPDQPAPRLASLPSLAHHHARATLDLWWDYSKVMTWERPLAQETMLRGGGASLRQRVEKLEKISHSESVASIQGHDFSLHSGERQVATQYEDIRADHRYRYEWVDAQLPEGGFGIDTFCGNGYGTWQLSKRRHIWGIDGSVQAVQLAQQHYRTPQSFFSQAYYPFSLPKESFDFAISLESVEHVEDGEGFFASLVQSLKPGGLLCFSTPCEEKLPHAKFSDIFHFHHKHYSFEETQNLALAHGLEILDWAGQNVYAFLPNGKPVPLANDNAMRLQEKTIGQFLILLCRKACSV